MKIFDCFKFNGEFELLELRIRLLWDHVDYFCIVESKETHSGLNKVPLFEKFIDQFPDFKIKIRYLCLEQLKGNGPWERENFQRNSLGQLYLDAEPDDLIIVSDLDEIINPECLMELKKNKDIINDIDIIHFKQYMLNFKLNFVLLFDIREPEGIYRWAGPVATKIGGLSPQEMRNVRNGNHKFKSYIFENGGWHLSNFGDSQFFKNKIMSFAENYKPEVQATINSWREDIDYIQSAIDWRLKNLEDNLFWSLYPLETIYSEYFIETLRKCALINLEDRYIKADFFLNKFPEARFIDFIGRNKKSLIPKNIFEKMLYKIKKSILKRIKKIKAFRKLI